jgi:hypothetical protein
MAMDFIVNKAGAKIYSDPLHHELLPMPVVVSPSDQKKQYRVLIAGFGLGNIPLITVQEERGATAYRVPIELFSWVESLVELAHSNRNVLPRDAEFWLAKNGQAYVKILYKKK